MTVQLYEKLNNSDWKERKLGLEELAQILKDSDQIKDFLDSDLITVLKDRLQDSNRNLSCLTMDICGDLSTLIGKNFDRYSRIFLPLILSLLSDQKQQVRSKCIFNLDKISKIIGVVNCLPSVFTILLQDQPQIRKDLLQWLLDNDLDSELENALKPVFSCLLDRNSDGDLS
jgi:cytoskeleton-associated protein 5